MRRNNRPFLVLVILFSVCTATAYSQNILATFKLSLSATLEQTLAPQSIDLDKLTQVPDSMVSLVEIKDGKKVPIAAQIQKKEKRFLYWMVVSDKQKKSVHEYAIIEKLNASVTEPAGSNVTKANGSITLIGRMGNRC
jgi:general stress protein CsbA